MPYSLSALSLLLCLACLSSTVTAAVTLVTDYDDYACPNTNAVITCTTDTGHLVWASGGTQVYRTSDSLNQPHSVGNFTVRLTSISGNTLISTAVINATINGSTISCHDSLSAGGSSDSVVVLLATTPSEPLNLINSTTTYNTVVLNWTTPTSLGGVPIDQYRVTISPSLQSSCPGQCVTNITESLTISNLQYGITYTITVAASNCAGMGLSQTLNVTITAIEPSPPVNLETCMSSIQQVRVTWECPSSMNILSPPITNYTVTLTSPGLQTDTQYIPHVGCNCPYSLTRPVQSGSHLYTVSVTATNSVGQSTNNPYTNIFTTPNISADSSLVTTTMVLMSINMSWVVCQGIPAQFEVGYSLDSQSDSSSISVTLPLIDTLLVSLNGLNPNSFYRSEVQLTVGGNFPAIDGPSFTTDKELTPSQCSSLIYTVTETASVTPDSSTTGDTSRQCANESNLYLGIGVLAAVAAIAIIIVILVACVLIVKLRNKKNQGPVVVDRDLQRLQADSYSHLNTFTNSESKLLSSSPQPIGVAPVSPWNTMTTMMTSNDSYGHRPPQPLPNEGVSEYAEIPSYHMPPHSDITTNPTYTQVDLNEAEPDKERMSPPPKGQVDNPAYGTAGNIPAPYIKPVNRYAVSPIADEPSDEYI